LVTVREPKYDKRTVQSDTSSTTEPVIVIGGGQAGECEANVPFSCKGRDICPSCATRRMVETGAHLVDNVLPRVPPTWDSARPPPVVGPCCWPGSMNAGLCSVPDVGEPMSASEVLPARSPPQMELHFHEAANVADWPDMDQTADGGGEPGTCLVESVCAETK